MILRCKLQATSNKRLTAAVGFDRMYLERKHMQTKKEKQYQTALDATFTKEGYLRSNLNPKDIAARVYTAAEIAIGDGGFRAREIVENFQQLMEMDSARYVKQRKFYG